MEYTHLTEVSGASATPEQLERISHRYQLTAHYAEGKRLLEVGCGPGLGLGYLLTAASSVVGGDYTADLLRQGRAHYEGRVPLVRLDAHRLPFAPGSFDVVGLLEAIYYLEDPARFVADARRVLDPGGLLIICTVNKDWDGFSPSPQSYRYLSVPELSSLLEREGLIPEMYGAFEARRVTVKQSVVSVVRRAAVALNLMPGTMKGREFLKRVFHGPLLPIPAELEISGPAEPGVVRLDGDRTNADFKIIYAIGRLPADAA